MIEVVTELIGDEVFATALADAFVWQYLLVVPVRVSWFIDKDCKVTVPDRLKVLSSPESLHRYSQDLKKICCGQYKSTRGR